MSPDTATQSRSGFTILETMVALAILGLVVVALLQLVAGASAMTAKDHAYTQAMALAEQRMETLLTGGAEAALRADGREESFAPPFEAFRAHVDAKRIPGRDLVEVGVVVRWDHAGGGQIDLATRRRVGLPPEGAP